MFADLLGLADCILLLAALISEFLTLCLDTGVLLFKVIYVSKRSPDSVLESLILLTKVRVFLVKPSHINVSLLCDLL